VGEFSTDFAAVNFPEQRNDVTQLHAPIAGTGQPTGHELGIHVAVAKAEIVQLQDARRRPLHEAQRVNVSDLVAAQAIDLDQPRNSRLFLAGW
jgi:uncharacterized protein YabE (DUF348 family)